ncbi:hypothetical protein ACOSQ4_009496 [Xanthoceras sorbifolium]
MLGRACPVSFEGMSYCPQNVVKLVTACTIPHTLRHGFNRNQADEKFLQHSDFGVEKKVVHLHLSNSFYIHCFIYRQGKHSILLYYFHYNKLYLFFFLFFLIS